MASHGANSFKYDGFGAATNDFHFRLYFKAETKPKTIGLIEANIVWEIGLNFKFFLTKKHNIHTCSCFGLLAFWRCIQLKTVKLVIYVSKSYPFAHNALNE